jgi:hypothetical protein
MRHTQKAGSMARKSGYLPTPTYWHWQIDERQSDKNMALLRTNERFIKACQPILDSIAPAFFAVYRDRDMALDAASENLTHLAHAVVTGAGPARSIYVEDCTEGTGRSWKQIKTLPKSIERLASAIRAVHRGPFFALFAEAYRDLPCLLKEYATILANLTIFDYTRPKQYLMETVEDWTGGPHRAEVAKLLQAAADALGLRGQYDAQDLRQARSRYNKTRAK